MLICEKQSKIGLLGVIIIAYRQYNTNHRFLALLLCDLAFLATSVAFLAFMTLKHQITESSSFLTPNDHKNAIKSIFYTFFVGGWRKARQKSVGAEHARRRLEQSTPEGGWSSARQKAAGAEHARRRLEQSTTEGGWSRTRQKTTGVEHTRKRCELKERQAIPICSPIPPMSFMFISRQCQ